MAKRKKQSIAGDPAQRRSFTVYFQREPDGVFTAHIPALDIVTEGTTMDEAKEMAKDAIAGWIEAAEELGKVIPDDVETAQVEVGG